MQRADDQPAYLRIGELSRRVGVSSELLRAWERRYGLLSPMRTPGGFRLYRDEDERRIERMLGHLEAGASAAEAARLALAEELPAVRAGDSPGAQPVPLADVLRPPLDRYDEGAAQIAFDRLLAAFTLETVLRDAVLSFLGELGDRWARVRPRSRRSTLRAASCVGGCSALPAGGTVDGAPAHCSPPHRATSTISD